MYGGYNPSNNWERDWNTYETIIRGASEPTLKAKKIHSNSMIEGFTFREYTTGATHVVIVEDCFRSFIIQYVKIEFGECDGSYCCGLYPINFGNCLFQHSQIIGASNVVAGTNYGVYSFESAPHIHDTTISMGSRATVNVYYCNNSNDYVTNSHLIHDGGYGVVCRSGATPTFSGNIIKASDDNLAYVAVDSQGVGGSVYTDPIFSGNLISGTIILRQTNNATFTNNVIKLTGTWYGIECRSYSDPDFFNNTIIAYQGTDYQYLIRMTNMSGEGTNNPHFRNNILAIVKTEEGHVRHIVNETNGDGTNQENPEFFLQ